MKSLAISPRAHAYTWATAYEPLKDLKVHISFSTAIPRLPAAHPSGTAVRDGMLCSVCMLSVLNNKIPEYDVDGAQLDELITTFPDVKMIMTDAPEKLIKALSERGRR